MGKELSNNIWDKLFCPNCTVLLEKTDNGCKCKKCKVEYTYTDFGALDLRLKNPKTFTYEVELGTPLLPEEGFDFELLTINDTQEVDFSSIEIPHHLTKELVSYFPKAKNNNEVVLDLGCGSTVHRETCEQCGYEYIGLDYGNNKAPILGDGHALPFDDHSIDFVMSIAVLEHIRYPIIMMKEVYRVLKPGGKFIGSVAFLEPFHSNSYYHHTHFGTYNSLYNGGFTIEKIAPSDEWSVLVAQSNMSLFPRMPFFWQKLMVMPLHLLHKLWWYLSRFVSKKATENKRLLITSGSFTFIVHKQI